MNLLTIQILVRNNEDTIDVCLESIQPLVERLKAKIIIGNYGSTDNTIKKCKKHEIIPLSLKDNFSQVRNSLLKRHNSKWNLYINPYETILNCDPIIDIISLKEKNVCKVNVLQGDSFTKQIRFWHTDTNLKFKNPVFEVLDGTGVDTNIYFASGENDSALMLDMSKKWIDSEPLNKEAVYYMACAHLANKNWKSFLDYAEIYLHQQKNISTSVIMTRYYFSLIKCYIEKNYQEAIRSLIPCLGEKPMMAEYWCLLGDIYFAIHQYDKAICFYENAIILGSKRLKNDDYPMEISKYKEYPQKMIENCNKIKQSSKIYVSRENLIHL